MKITKIEPMGLRYMEPNDYNSTRHTMLVRVETDEGIVGWGEGMAMWPEAVAATVAIVEHGFAPLLIGTDPMDIEVNWLKMKRHSWWYGMEGGIASFAVSAMDMAMWDIKGKALNLPLYRLIGGKCNDKIPANASIHIKHATHEENAREIHSYYEEGYQSCKVGFGKNGHAKLGQTEAYDMEFVKEVRRLIGMDAEFMVDIGNNVRWDVSHAVRMVNKFAEYNIHWIEDPFQPNQLEAMKELRTATSALIAAGERESTLDGYSRLIHSGAADIIAIDPARSDGITGFLKVLTLVEHAKKQFNTHAWSTAITTAASVHLSFASPHVRIMELKPIRNPMQHDLVKQPIEHKDGWVYPIEEPGLGVEVNEEIIQKHRFV